MGSSDDAQRRVVVLVLDGLGIGAQADAPDEDRGSNTLASVHAATGVTVPHLRSMGLGELAGVAELAVSGPPAAAYARCELGYVGADSFLGHAQMMGHAPAVEYQTMSTVKAQVATRLRAAGHEVEPLLEGRSALLVDGAIVVADNMEARAGLGINVTASMDAVDLDAISAVADVVRATVRTPRVILVAGQGFSRADVLRTLLVTPDGRVGVDTPGLGVYDGEFRVRHLSLDVDERLQLPKAVVDAGGQVTLIGKAADVLGCESAVLVRPEDTPGVMRATVDALGQTTHGLVLSNVQETDLAGHAQNPQRFANVLELVDVWVPKIVEALGERDVLMVTADHGNDPSIGHPLHTREAVPLIVAGPGVRTGRSADRASLADVAATVAELLELPRRAVGSSWAPELITDRASGKRKEQA
jgi:phosphopentomutase